jgi:hypothetical protein
VIIVDRNATYPLAIKTLQQARGLPESGLLRPCKYFEP